MSLPILVVEDNPVNQKLVVRYLECQGFEVAVASTTKEADALLSERRFGLLLLDLSLPGEDGLSLAERLSRSGSDTPVVALTAHAMPGDRERALAAGCVDYLPKPIELKALLATARKWLRQERAERPAEGRVDVEGSSWSARS